MIDVEQSHPAIAPIGPLTESGPATWQAIAELVELVSDGSWAIVGGQMVAIHAALAAPRTPAVCGAASSGGPSRSMDHLNHPLTTRSQPISRSERRSDE